MLDVIKKAIEKEMDEYAAELHDELSTKYLQEFDKKMYSHRNKITLDIISNMKMEKHMDITTGETNIHIKL